MRSRTKSRHFNDTYFELVKEFPLAAIRTERDLDEAQKVIDSLLCKAHLDPGEEEYLEALSDLVELYEEKHHPIPPASDNELLRHLIDAKGVTQADVARATGIARSTISEILAGKRPFSKTQMAKFAEYFKVDRSVFVANL